MAQLPNSELNNKSLMDEVKVNPECKQPIIDENEFCDNDSLQNHATNSHDGDDNNIHHTIIQNRDTAPEPPSNISNLTMALLQQHDESNPQQSMLAGTNLIQQNSTGGNSSQQIPDLGLSTLTNNNVPDMLIQPLIEMGFTKAKAVYALQQSENMMGSMSVDYAITWLFEHPNFIPPDTSNITNTIGNMLGNDFLTGMIGTNSTNNKDNVIPPNNSPSHNSNGNGNNNNNNITNASTSNDDFALYNLIENLGNDSMMNISGNKSKSSRLYTHSETIGSAATIHEDEKSQKINDSMNNNKISESKNDIIDDQNPSIIHHVTTSTVASELSVLSGAETLNTNTTTMTSGSGNTKGSNNNTKDTISQLYMQQHAMDIINKNNVSENMIPNDLKMVIIVRKDLKMSSGKVAAQCCHGCLGVVMDIINMQYSNKNNNNSGGNSNGLYDLRVILRLWRMNGEKKIVLQCANEKKLLELKDDAFINGLPHYLVCDAGHTQIKAGSKTVLAIGPYPSVEIDQITKELKLY